MVVNLGLYRANITNIQFTNHRAGISDISGASPRPFGPFSGQVRWELLQYHQGGGLKDGADDPSVSQSVLTFKTLCLRLCPNFTSTYCGLMSV